MSIWLCRAGRYGEYEARFLEDNKIFYTFEEIGVPLSSFGSKQDLQEYFLQIIPAAKEKAVAVYAAQGNIFCNKMKVGDWIVTPSKSSPGLLRFAEISGDYIFDDDAEESYRHARPVKWFAEIRREEFEQDIQFSFGSAMTICNIKQESRIKHIVSKFLKSLDCVSVSSPPPQSPPPPQNLELLSLDTISEYIIQNYKGHGLARIIEAILKAKGFTVFRSPKGADHGVDLLASSGSLGFASPKICVQVKSTEDAVERVVLDQLIGTMANVGAEYGLLVSWGGFKSSIIRDVPMQFFKVRLWSRMEIINELLQCYDLLGEEIKQEIPLKRIWILDSEEQV
jgi:restriction system protein